MRSPVPFGKYLLLDRISVGGMAEVFKAKSYGVEGFEKIIAIKRILPTMGEDRDFIKMFIDEAKIAGQLAHANICQIFELGRIDGSHFIAMEYIWGKDLLQIQNRLRKVKQAMPVSMACFAIGKVLEGLDYAHRKRDPLGRPLEIVHRDCSPQNVLVSYEGEVKVIDFGIAKATSRNSRTMAGVLKGKFGYMSPEQVRGLPLDRRSDIFALGTMLFECLTGERLFQGETDFSTLEKVRNVDIRSPRELNPDIPEAIEKIILKALAKDVDERYQWCSEMQADLQAYLMSQDVLFTPKSLAGWLKDVFATEIDRERTQLEQYKRVGRDGLIAGVPAAEAKLDVVETLGEAGSAEGDATQLGLPDFEDVNHAAAAAGAAPGPGAEVGPASGSPAATGARSDNEEESSDFGEEAPTEIFGEIDHGAKPGEGPAAPPAAAGGPAASPAKPRPPAPPGRSTGATQQPYAAAGAAGPMQHGPHGAPTGPMVPPGYPMQAPSHAPTHGAAQSPQHAHPPGPTHGAQQHMAPGHPGAGRGPTAPPPYGAFDGAPSPYNQAPHQGSGPLPMAPHEGHAPHDPHQNAGRTLMGVPGAPWHGPQGQPSGQMAAVQPQPGMQGPYPSQMPQHPPMYGSQADLGGYRPPMASPPYGQQPPGMHPGHGTGMYGAQPHPGWSSQQYGMAPVEAPPHANEQKRKSSIVRDVLIGVAIAAVVLGAFLLVKFFVLDGDDQPAATASGIATIQVSLDAGGSAELFVDGERKAAVGDGQQIPVTPGKRKVTLVGAKGAKCEQEVDLAAGKTTTVQCKLGAAAAGSAATPEPAPAVTKPADAGSAGAAIAAPPPVTPTPTAAATPGSAATAGSAAPQAPTPTPTKPADKPAQVATTRSTEKPPTATKAADKPEPKPTQASASRPSTTTPTRPASTATTKPASTTKPSSTAKPATRPEPAAAATTKGFLQVYSKPSAKIAVDGADTGLSTPITGTKLGLAAGKHKITFTLGGDKHTFSVTIKAGETMTLSKDLQ